MAIDLAKELAKAFAKNGKPIGVRACSLIQSAPGTRTPGSESAGTNPTTTSHAATGFLEESTSTALLDGQQVRTTRTKISLFGASIAGGAVPVKGSKIVFDGVTYRVTTVDGDGVGALYECACVKA
jgi:hypothetical protein